MEKKAVKKTVKKTNEMPVETKVMSTKTVADQIWDDIKNLRIDMFALPGQLVSKYCVPVKIEPSKCYLKITATSVLPSLESAIYPKYVVERTDLYIIVALATTPVK